MKSTTVVIAAGAAEARLVVKTYSPVSRSGFVVAADIPAALVFERHQLKFFHLSDFLPRRTTNNDSLAFRLVSSFLNHPQVKATLTLDHLCYTPAFAEMLRHRTQTQLIEFYNLVRLCQQTGAKRVIVGQAFAQLTIDLVKQQLKLKIETLPQPLFAWWERFKFKLERLIRFWLEIGTLLTRHPVITLQAIYLWLRPHLLPQAPKIVIFSNGLHLASYHSLINSLSPRHSLAVITDPPTILDRFYLAQYRLTVSPIKFVTDLKVVDVHRQLRHRLKQLTQVSLPAQPLPTWLTPTTWRIIWVRQLHYLAGSWLNSFLVKVFTFRRLLLRLKPKLLITTHEPGPTAVAFVLAAKKLKISTLLLLHGSPSKNHFFFSDKEIVWGPALKKFLVAHGASSSRLLTGGQPIFFDYQNFFTSRTSPTKGRPKKIGILTSGYGANEPHQLGYFLDLLPHLAKLRPRPQIYLRTHPQQYFDDLGKVALQLGLVLHLNPPQTVEEFIASVDVIITQTSTAVLIAGLSDKPVVYFPAFHPLANQGSLWHYRPFFATTTATQAAQLTRELLNRPLSRQEIIRQQDFLRRFCGILDASCGPKLAATINKLYFSK